MQVQSIIYQNVIPNRCPPILIIIIINNNYHYWYKQIKDVPELDPMNQSVVATLSYSAFRQDPVYTRSLEHPITRTFDR